MSITARISRLERTLEPSLRRRIPSFRGDFTWLDQAGEAKVAAATLDALCVFFEVTRNDQAAHDATVSFIRELAVRLKDDPSADLELLSEFEMVRPEAEPTVNRVLDAIGWRGPRLYPTKTERRIIRQEVEQTGGRLLRPLPPGIERAEPRIKIPQHPIVGV